MTRAPGAAGGDAARYPLGLPARWYHDPEVFALERARIFAREWCLLGPEASLAAPGDFVCAGLAGRPVVAARAADGGLHAFLNVCRHRAGPVATGEAGNCERFRCAYHGWVYGLDGRLLRASGFESDPRRTADDLALVPVRVAAWRGLVFVNLDPGAPPLEEWLGDLDAIAGRFPAPGSLELHARVELRGDANWKSYCDNSAEGYHLAHVHPGLTAAVGDSRVDVRPYEDGRFVGFDVHYRGNSDVRGGDAFWVYKFPGFLLHLSGDSVNAERVEPLGPGQVRLTRWFWFAAGLDATARDRAVADSERVMREDVAICETVQRNLDGGGEERGPLSPQREPGTIYFQRLVGEALA